MYSHAHIYDSCKWLKGQYNRKGQTYNTPYIHTCVQWHSNQSDHSISESITGLWIVCCLKKCVKVYHYGQEFTHILYKWNCSGLAIFGQYTTGFSLTMTSGTRTCSVHFHLSPPTDVRHHRTQSGPIHLSEVGWQLPWQPSPDSQ